jgi:hypothetical protein
MTVQALSEAANRRLAATGQQADIANILATLQANNMATRGNAAGQLGGLQMQDAGIRSGALQGAASTYGQLSSSAAQLAGMKTDVKSQNLSRQYAEFVRQQQLTPALQAALQYGTSFPPNKPVVPEGGGTDWGAAALGAGSSILSAILPFAFLSDRNSKEKIVPVAAGDVLNSLQRLPLYRWNYKGDRTSHMGPMAQDFQSAFGVGDGKTINLVDVVGVMLASQKSLAERMASRG